MPLLLPGPHALLHHLLIKLVEISAIFVVVKKGAFLYGCVLCTKPVKLCGENVFLRFPNHFFAQGTLWCFQKIWWGFFFLKGKGERFQCFECRKWKRCKLMAGAGGGGNEEKVEKPKGNVFSFLFRPALSLLLYVLTSLGTRRKEIVLANGFFSALCKPDPANPVRV